MIVEGFLTCCWRWVLNILVEVWCYFAWGCSVYHIRWWPNQSSFWTNDDVIRLPSFKWSFNLIYIEAMSLTIWSHLMYSMWCSYDVSYYKSRVVEYFESMYSDPLESLACSDVSWCGFWELLCLVLKCFISSYSLRCFTYYSRYRSTRSIILCTTWSIFYTRR